jgi:hypothetical protein
MLLMCGGIPLYFDNLHSCVCEAVVRRPSRSIYVGRAAMMREVRHAGLLAWVLWGRGARPDTGWNVGQRMWNTNNGNWVYAAN